MKLRVLQNRKKLDGKVVLIRIDANVPIKSRKAVDGPQGKIARAAVDIDWLRQRGAKVVVLSHLGRPGGKRIAAYSLAPVANRLKQLLGVPVKLCSDLTGEKVKRRIDAMESGEILLLENMRFHPGEKTNDLSFAKELASLGDIYINDAFADSHRAHASVSAITKEIPSYAGPLFVHEVKTLESLMNNPKSPVVLVLGGLKVETKIPILEFFLPKADIVLIGGAIAHPFLLAQGDSIGSSVFDKEGTELAGALLKKWKKKILLPEDISTVVRLSKRSKIQHKSIKEIDAKDIIIDMGPKTKDRYKKHIEKASTIVWNGPLGYCEVLPFCSGTRDIAEAISKRTGKAKTVVGGGDTIPVIESLNLSERFTLVSTGGGAMLDFLGGKVMPGVEALRID